MKKVLCALALLMSSHSYSTQIYVTVEGTLNVSPNPTLTTDVEFLKTFGIDSVHSQESPSFHGVYNKWVFTYDDERTGSPEQFYNNGAYVGGSVVEQFYSQPFEANRVQDQYYNGSYESSRINTNNIFVEFFSILSDVSVGDYASIYESYGDVTNNIGDTYNLEGWGQALVTEVSIYNPIEVPEPSSLILLGLSCLGLGVGRRIKKQGTYGETAVA